MRSTQLIPRIHPQRRGIALLLVVIVMALATVMAYGMLANAVMQQEAAANQTSAAQADALSESGVGLAMYYLQHPSQAPALAAASGNFPAYWAGNGSLTFSGLSGSCGVTVAPYGSAGNLWTISSVGTSSGAGGSIHKTVSGLAQVNGAFSAPQALTVNQAVTVSSNITISGSPTAIVSTGAVTIKSGVTVTGNVYSPSVGGSGHLTGTHYAGPAQNPVPPSTALGNFSTYTYNNVSYPAQLLGSGVALLLTPTNPGGVFEQASGDLTLVGPMTVPGTVYVPNGNLILIGPVTIGPPAAGMPAIVVSGNVNLSLLLTSLTVQGSVYAGGGLICPDATESTTITGSLLTNNNFSGYPGTLHVTYNSSLVNVGGLTKAGAYTTPQQVKLTNWNP